ncbi:hypothetical protein T492DRAFT_1039573 [Pavlovales sp. CCMP2436]|nr:hypothetical protein T492DRAFT_1039573 [Pavlovales sp. CCMP2436]
MQPDACSPTVKGCTSDKARGPMLPGAPSKLSRKLARFALVNTLVGAVAACAWAVGRMAPGFFGLWLGSCTRCALSVGLISALTHRGVPLSSRRQALRWGECALIWAKIALYFGPADALALTAAEWLAPYDAPLGLGSGALAWSGALALAARGARFVAVSFAWELAFDLCHYWVHRACHASTALYSLVHKTHHQHRSPSPLTTYDHSVLDVLASNTLPALAAFGALALAGLPIRGEAERQLLFAFKAYVEVGGHAGVDARPRSFPQFMWLPAAILCGSRTPDGYAGIGGHTREHDWHHAVLRCNFSKRFRVWDVVFGTYEWPADRSQ